MPTPLEILLDPVSLIVIGTYLTMMIWEAIRPARKLPYVKGWKIKGILSFFVFFFLSSYLPLAIEPFLSPFQLMDLSGWGTAYGALTGVLLYEFGLYLWHRFIHHSGFMWRTFHQMHHSAERMDSYGAFFFNPLDMIGFTLLGTICFVLLVGLSPQATTLTLLITNFFSVFQHTNIKTPRWLGYLVQRPESHAYHHGRGIHRCNYSDLPVFDILFGTFVNPKEYSVEAGFYEGSSNKIKEMLLFKDISRMPADIQQAEKAPAIAT